MKPTADADEKHRQRECGPRDVEEPERFGEGSAVASSLREAEPRGLQLLGLVRLLPMDFNEG